MESTIQINFGRPLPLFPLPGVVLLPHSVQHLHIFEPRYRQMVKHSLDHAGQIAMATYAGEEWRDEDESTPELRPAVCVGQIVQHHQFADGKYNLVVVGICRAGIARIDEPQGDRLYRLAHLRLIENPMEHGELSAVREQLKDLLSTPTLNQVRGVSRVMPLFKREDVPTVALLELISSTLVEDPELKYALLAEPDPDRRAGLLRRELRRMDRLIRAAQWQMQQNWPKGMSWN